jgi:hypothetical protein
MKHCGPRLSLSSPLALRSALGPVQTLRAAWSNVPDYGTSLRKAPLFSVWRSVLLLAIKFGHHGVSQEQSGGGWDPLSTLGS